MSSTPTTSNGFDKQAYGDNPDLWGIDNLNTDLDLIDESLDQEVLLSTTGGTTVLNATNFATNQARRRKLVISGTLTSPAVITIPNVPKWYIVVNLTTGAYTLTIGTSGGTGAVVNQNTVGYGWDVRCDGVGAGTTTVLTPEPGALPLPTMALDMNSQKITNLTNGSNPQDAVAFNQLPGPAWYSTGTAQNSNFNAVINTFYVADTTGSSFTATLPGSPTEYGKIAFLKIGTGALTLGLNSLNFNGQSTFSPTIITPGFYEIAYTTSGIGWVINRQLVEYAAQNSGFTAIGSAEFPVDCTAGNVTVTLPSPSGINGNIKFKKFGTYQMILSGTVNGAAGSLAITQELTLEIYDSGSSRGWV